MQPIQLSRAILNQLHPGPLTLLRTHFTDKVGLTKERIGKNGQGIQSKCPLCISSLNTVLWLLPHFARLFSSCAAVLGTRGRTRCNATKVFSALNRLTERSRGLELWLDLGGCIDGVGHRRKVYHRISKPSPSQNAKPTTAILININSISTRQHAHCCIADPALLPC